MASTIPGGDILSGALNVIAQSLLLPVMILLIIFIIFSVIEIGSLLAEYTSRVKITAKEKDILVKSIAISKTQEEMCEIINNSKLTKNDKTLLCTIATLNNEIYSKPTREIIAKKLT
jgi:biopolymer transport protein ExbB/TolQ